MLVLQRLLRSQSRAADVHPSRAKPCACIGRYKQFKSEDKKSTDKSVLWCGHRDLSYSDCCEANRVQRMSIRAGRSHALVSEDTSSSSPKTKKAPINRCFGAVTGTCLTAIVAKPIACSGCPSEQGEAMRLYRKIQAVQVRRQKKHR